MNVTLKREILDKLSARGILVYVAMSMSPHGNRSTVEELAAIVRVKPEAMKACMDDAQLLQNLELKPARKKAEKKTAGMPIIPEWIPRQAWRGYVESRRKPLTPYAAELAIKKLEGFRNEGMDLAEVLNQSALNGWTGLFPLKTVSAPYVPPATPRLQPTEFRR